MAASKAAVLSGSLSASAPSTSSLLRASLAQREQRGRANGRAPVSHACPQQRNAPVGPDDTQRRVGGQVLGVPAADVGHERARRLRAQEARHLRPRVVPRVAEVRRDAVVDAVHVLGLDLGRRHGGSQRQGRTDRLIGMG